MKWFKHIAASGDDPDIDDAISKFGPESYYTFFRIIEVMSQNFSISSPGVVELSVSFFKRKFRISWVRVQLQMDFFQSRNRIYYKFIKNDGLEMIRLKCPKLKDLTDEFTQKKIKDESGDSRDKLPIESRPKNRTEDKKNKVHFSFEKIWIRYPNKVGRKAAERHFKVSVKTEEDWGKIQIALGKYLQSERVKKGFIQNGSTWFNNWLDWLDYEEPEVKEKRKVVI